MVSGSLPLLYFLLGFHGGRQGSGPDRGRSPVEWGDFPSVRPSIRLSVRSPLWAIQPGLRASQPSLNPETWLAGWLGLMPGWLGLRPGWLGLRPGWLGLRPGWMAQRGGRTNERMNKRTNGQTENLPILQDFVPYRGRCPACPLENQGESRAGQENH